MLYTIRGLIKAAIFIGFVLCVAHANAQVSLIQNAIDKIESHKNFSYQSIMKQKDEPNDTLIIYQHGIFLKAQENKNFGYLFSVETSFMGHKSVDLYNGQNLITLNLSDSSYRVKASETDRSSLLGQLKRIKKQLDKRPTRIVKISDTTINAIACSHLIINTYDTIINKDHNYAFTHLFINKLSGMPECMITKSRTIIFGNAATNSYTEDRYTDYKFDENNIDIASFAIPNGFRPQKEHQPATPLLEPGTVAPDWSLSTADGKKISLTQMKGKVVLLDFYFIGCLPCMLSLKSLNNIQEKYKNHNFVIASITERDSKRSVLGFKKKYHLKYPGYINGADVFKSYHVKECPTFYFIDKEGKVASVILGYDDNFEEKATSVINNLLKQ